MEADTFFIVYGYIHGEGLFFEAAFKQRLDANNYIEYYNEECINYYDELVSVEVKLQGEYGYIMKRHDFEGI